MTHDADSLQRYFSAVRQRRNRSCLNRALETRSADSRSSGGRRFAVGANAAFTLQ